jgi:transcriptional regulator with XRE-family HTH domain
VPRRKYSLKWVLTRGVLRKLRMERGWTQAMVAARSGMSVRQVKSHESRRPPKSIRSDYLLALAEVFKKDLKQIAEFDGPADSQPSPPSASHARKPVGEASVSELEQSINGGEPQSTAPPTLSTLSQRSERERQVRLDDVRIETSRGPLPLLGLNWFKLIWSRPLKYDGARFVIIGDIDDYQGLSLAVRKTFDVKDGGKYRLVRWLEEKTFFYTTAFAFTSEQADTLTPIALTKARTAMIVRVVYKEPVPRKWPGFYFYGSEKPFEFGFLCEEILPSIPTIQTPKPQKSTTARRRARGATETSLGDR